MSDQKALTYDQVTYQWAITRAATCLQGAEMQTDRDLARLLLETAESFMTLAVTIQGDDD